MTVKDSWLANLGLVFTQQVMTITTLPVAIESVVMKFTSRVAGITTSVTRISYVVT